jgi:hypothetical protein
MEFLESIAARDPFDGQISSYRNQPAVVASSLVRPMSTKTDCRRYDAKWDHPSDFHQ